MNEKIRAHVARYNESQGWGTTDKDVIETIIDNEFCSGDRSQHRWWTTYLGVSRVDGMLIGFGGAETTGDDNAHDLGWEFDPDSICEVDESEAIIKVYVRHQQ